MAKTWLYPSPSLSLSDHRELCVSLAAWTLASIRILSLSTSRQAGKAFSIFPFNPPHNQEIRKDQICIILHRSFGSSKKRPWLVLSIATVFLLEDCSKVSAHEIPEDGGWAWVKRCALALGTQLSQTARMETKLILEPAKQREAPYLHASTRDWLSTIKHRSCGCGIKQIRC